MTIQQIENIGCNIMSNPMIFRKLIEYKSTLQNEIIPLLTNSELNNIKNSKVDNEVIKKLSKLAYNKYKSSANNETLYILSLSVGTILKEYEWGDYYATNAGICELSKRIIDF